MAIIYEENEPRRNFQGSTANWDATALYLRHAANWYYLKFILLRSDDWQEKRQAQRELDICERKLEYWTRHPLFDRELCNHGISKLKSIWADIKEQPK